MRAIHFMMIDYIKVKQQLYFIPLFIVIAAAMGFSNLGALSYMMFIAIIFATAPFGACKRGDAGFLVLLPSTVTHRVLGRFLYGVSFLAVTLLISGIMTFIYQMVGVEMEPWAVAASLFLLAFCLFVITIEYLILYLVGEHLAPQLLGIVRMVPAMGAFFAMMYLMDDKEFVEDISALQDMGAGLMQMGLIAAAVAFVLMLVTIVICVKVTAKRDYV